MANVDHQAEIKTLNGVLSSLEQKLNDVGDMGVKSEEGGGIVVSPEARDEAKRILGEMEECKSAIVNHEKAAGLRQFLSEGSGQGNPASVGQLLEMTDAKSLGAMVIESDEWREWKDAGFRRKNTTVEMDGTSLYLEGKKLDLGMVERKDIYTARGGQFTTNAFGTVENVGLIDRARRKIRVRDLLQVGNTTSNLIEFIRVTGFTNGAKPVAEREDGSGNPVLGVGGVNFQLKPESDLTFEPDTAPVRTIAHTIRAAKTVLDDEPRLQGLINTEMLYGLQLAEDAQLLAGDGSGASIVGLLNTPGIVQYTQRNNGATPPSVTERKSEAIRRSITLVMLAYYEATGVVVSPLDWEDIELEKDNQGRPILVTNIAIGAEKQVWRLPVTDTPALAQGTFLTGAFGIAARVWDRQQSTVDISTEDRDNFVRNAVTIRAEERLALEVSRPEAFVQGRFLGNMV